MTRQTKRRSVDSGMAASYAGAGDEFFRTAQLAQSHEYWNAAGLLLVHASIAYADAVTIQLSGQQSSSDNHQDVVTLIKEAARDRKGRDKALHHLSTIIQEKNRVSYTGQSFRSSDVASLLKHAARFQDWVRELLG